ncbi:serine hydrolase domain-containing protein [Bradyrhizobium liaoningense]|uniref:serine hydrolase domain-containing protein n=1 Tax=Bradyrhizobium liaoningense TaxID=43992 RepID=UPI001BAD4371|nr:serine hydrolase [Bradyrhizobium liaoningense]MBR0860283.1 serine hydrolase [Bradyrhizobium liaoningense]
MASPIPPALGQQRPAISPDKFAADVVERLDQAIAQRRVWNIHGLVILQDGNLLVERYFEGQDNERGVGSLGTVKFAAETLHDLRSCSKSIVALLYGIALQQGKVPAPEASLLSGFPEYGDLADEQRSRVTVHHALSMTMGTDWDESSFPYADPRNSEIAMDNAPDRYRYVLERPIVDRPGMHWTYCGGATALLARLIAKGTGKSLLDFARESLFDPLGMGPTKWATGPDGEPFAASGARMSVRDLARIGTLMLSGGQLDGQQIVPSEWITRCTTPVVSSDELRRYGYQWFLLDVAFGKPKGWAAGHLERMWMAQGEGGQRLFIIPALQLIIALTAGNYGTEDQWIPPTRVLREVVLASVP